MKCYCYETASDFVFCVENVEDKRIRATCFGEWEARNGTYLFSYPLQEVAVPGEREQISGNFARLGPDYLASMVSPPGWQEALGLIAQRFQDGQIEWYLVGSAGDALRGIGVTPHDIDIVVHTKDFFRAKDLCYRYFPTAVIAPFSDNGGRFAMPFFGRLFLAGIKVEIGANEMWNPQHRPLPYEAISWNGFPLLVDAFQLRYQTELARSREDRIRAFQEFCSHA